MACTMGLRIMELTNCARQTIKRSAAKSTDLWLPMRGPPHLRVSEHGERVHLLLLARCSCGLTGGCLRWGEHEGSEGVECGTGGRGTRGSCSSLRGGGWRATQNKRQIVRDSTIAANDCFSDYEICYG